MSRIDFDAVNPIDAVPQLIHCRPERNQKISAEERDKAFPTANYPKELITLVPEFIVQNAMLGKQKFPTLFCISGNLERMSSLFSFFFGYNKRQKKVKIQLRCHTM